MSYFRRTEPESSSRWARSKRDIVFIWCLAFHGYAWSCFSRNSCSPDFRAFMIFRQPMFRAEVSVAVGALKWKVFFDVAVLTFHCFSLANMLDFFFKLRFKCLLRLMTELLTSAKVSIVFKRCWFINGVIMFLLHVEYLCSVPWFFCRFSLCFRTLCNQVSLGMRSCFTVVFYERLR